MDNITHSLTAVMLSRAGLHRVCPRATLLLVLASNLPDSDIATRLHSNLLYLDYHRHLTHALVVAPLLAFLCVVVVWLVEGRREAFPWMRTMLVGTAGVLVHLGMDLWNNYGIRLLLPFSNEWFSLDLVMVVDVWLWGVLGLAVAAPALSRLVGSEMTSTRQKTNGRGWAIFALTFMVLWVGGRWMLHERAIEVLQSRVYHGQAPQRVAAWPTAFNPLHWTGYVSTEEAWSLHDVWIGQAFDPEKGNVYYKPDDAARINAARKTDTVRRFLQFAHYAVWRIKPVAEPEGGTEVEGVDVRFGAPEEGRFRVRVVLDQDKKVVSSEFTFGTFSLQRDYE